MTSPSRTGWYSGTKVLQWFLAAAGADLADTTCNRSFVVFR